MADSLKEANRLYKQGDTGSALQMYQRIADLDNALKASAEWNIQKILKTIGVNKGATDDRQLTRHNKVDKLNLNIACIVHLFHKSEFQDLAARLLPLNNVATFFVSGPYSENDIDIASFVKMFDNIQYFHMDNRGRDIRPFLKLLPYTMDFDLCLKIHTKKGTLPLGMLWKRVMFDSCLGSVSLINSIIKSFASDSSVSLLGSASLYKSGFHLMLGNKDHISSLVEKLNIPNVTPSSDTWGFFAGTVYWFRPSHYQVLLNHDLDHLFPSEIGALDGAPEHALERIFGLIPQSVYGKTLASRIAWECISNNEFNIEEPALDSQSKLSPSATLSQINSQIQLSENLHGSLDSINGRTLSGWVVKKEDNNSRRVRIEVDTTLYSVELLADQYRPDLERSQIGNGNHAFRIELPDFIFDGIEHEFAIYDVSTNVRLKQRSFLLPQVKRPFNDFTDFLKVSYVSPEVLQPLTEADFRVLGTSHSYEQILIKSDTNTITFSVIMPTHNRRSSLNRSIASVLAQSHTNFELILVDDGSTDGTDELVSSINDARIKYVPLDKNQGVSKARNVGLEMASGDYVAYLDSDNTWEAGHLAAVSSLIESNGNPVCYYTGQLIFIGVNRDFYGYRFGLLNLSLLANNNYIDMNCFGHANFKHTDHISAEQPRFNTDLHRFVDWDYIFRLVSGFRTISIPLFTSNYYINSVPNTITSKEGLLSQLNVVREANQILLRHIDTINYNSVKLAKPINIVIPSFNAHQALHSCIGSIVNHYDNELKQGLIRVSVIDNSSDEKNIHEIRRSCGLFGVELTELDKNYGFSYAVNLGLSNSDDRYDYVLLNNDAILTPGSLEELQSSCIHNLEVGITVPSQYFLPHTKTMQVHVPYSIPDGEVDVNISAHHDNIDYISAHHDGTYIELKFAPFFCVYLPQRTIRKIGCLDHIIGRHYRSDRIYSSLLKIYKFKIIFCPRARVYHGLQASTESLRNDDQYRDLFHKIFILNTWDATEAFNLGLNLPSWMPKV